MERGVEGKEDMRGKRIGEKRFVGKEDLGERGFEGKEDRKEKKIFNKKRI